MDIFGGLAPLWISQPIICVEGKVDFELKKSLILRRKILVLSKLGHSGAIFECQVQQFAYEASSVLFTNLRKTLSTYNV